MRSYATGQSRYRQFRRRLSILPMPTSERSLCVFVATLKEQQLTHKAIKCYLSAVRHLHIQYGQADPFASALPQITYVLSGVRRTQDEDQTRQRLSITPMELRAIKASWSQQPLSYDIVMLWAVRCTGFFVYLRAGKFTVSSLSAFDHAYQLTPQDITSYSYENSTLVRFHLKQSETDSFCHSADVYLNERQCHLLVIIVVGIHGCQGNSFRTAVYLQRRLLSIPLVTAARTAAGVVVSGDRLLMVYCPQL